MIAVFTESSLVYLGNSVEEAALIFVEKNASSMKQVFSLEELAGKMPLSTQSLQEKLGLTTENLESFVASAKEKGGQVVESMKDISHVSLMKIAEGLETAGKKLREMSN